MTSAAPTSYIICTSPRSGSTLLCHLLRETGVAGHPGSHFHTPSVDRWLEYFDLGQTQFSSRLDALHAVFERAIAKGRGGTPVFGLRLQRHSFAYFMAQLAALHPKWETDIERLRAAFGQTLFIHLTREDKLAQAVSRVLAEQTGLWHRSADGSELERTAPPQDPVYDHAAIGRHLHDLKTMDAEWEDWFAAQGIAPLRIRYAELSETPRAIVARVLSALGADPAISEGITVLTARLANEINADWMRRFQAGAG